MPLLMTLLRVTLALVVMTLITVVLDLIGIYVFMALESNNHLKECQQGKEENQKYITKLIMVCVCMWVLVYVR